MLVCTAILVNTLMASMLKTSYISYGGTAAIVTSMALVTGLDAVAANKATVVSALLIAAIADNLVDSLSIHVYQESARMELRSAWRGTLVNFLTRLAVCSSFVVPVTLLPLGGAVYVVAAWGAILLAVLTSIIARQRKTAVVPEVLRHLLMAVVVIVLSRLIGFWISLQWQ